MIPAALSYFALVFGAGFALGVARVGLVEPAVGARTAELLEAPLMLAVILAAARFVHRRRLALAGTAARLGTGLIALGLVLSLDVAVGVALRGSSLTEALVKPDPVAGAVYYGLLAIFAALPWALGRRDQPGG